MRLTLLGLILFFSVRSFAIVAVAGGFNSFSAGHNSPEITAGFGGSTWLLSGSSAGFKTKAYYTSNYVLRYYTTWSAGDFFWGKISFGAGGGAMYAVRGFKDTGASEDRATDLLLGPALRAQWNFGGPVFLAVDGVLGVRQLLQFVALNFQDCVSISVGVSAW